ncbi:hypothetical protein D1610_09680 [Sphingomonas gilva]|uniref:Terminase small subunit n=1 Tax=Sphingomonas gilva TaxID=2305907 RepID=A0A396RTS0_9SPHN|nr:hypothetical protein D1610_09680 [Sphingomonas gilva]
MPPAPPRDDEARAADFDPVPTRQRHDGWTPDKQVDFIEALAETGCVDHAARAVAMSPTAAYRLRARADAQSFRAAWDHALEYAVSRLSDAVISRAIHGVARPVFFQGEQIGERRYYDERLAMFILRTRDSMRYGRWIDQMAATRHPEAPPLGLARAVHRLADDAWADALGGPRPCTQIVFPRTRIEKPDPDAEEAALLAEHDDDIKRMQNLMWEAEERADAAEEALARARRADAPAKGEGDGA